MNKFSKAKILILFVVIFIANPAKATPRIDPSVDITYLGSFNVPNDDPFAYSGHGLTFYPNGNGGKGSLFFVRGDSANTPYVSEISIPPLVQSKSAASLNSAIVLQGFSNITRIGSIGIADQIGDVCYLSKQGGQTTDKLYYSAWNFYNVANEEYPSIGWSELTLSSPNSQGLWHVGSASENLANKVGKYLFAADKTWADTHVNGRYLLTGLTRGGGNLASQGPTLYAVAPWAVGNPPASGSNLPMTRLLQYNDQYPQPTTFPGFSTLDRWRGGAWIKAGAKHAVLFVGWKGNPSNDQECYGSGAECKDPCYDWKGYHAYPYSAKFIWYDVDDLASVAGGQKNPSDVIPYSDWTPTSSLWDSGPSCTYGLGGAAYDEVSQKLYVVELGVNMTTYSAYPVIHVFKVNGGGLSDTTPPAAPSGLSVQ